MSAAPIANRITPAGAGKTCGVALPYDFKPDHPRRCGENCAWSLQTLTAIGSPPQVRGKPIIILHSIAYARITPAGAGKTSERAVPTPEHGDHPRRCGENGHCCTCRWFCQGSPPQVRGKPQAARSFARGTGITPAGAGKTKNLLDAKEAGWDHPRRCGENVLYRFLCSLFQGSPPQVRGKLRVHSCLYPPMRITPAGAGKTMRQHIAQLTDEDHPRRCGENLKPKTMDTIT